jgi:hypothetical protein
LSLRAAHIILPFLDVIQGKPDYFSQRLVADKNVIVIVMDQAVDLL